MKVINEVIAQITEHRYCESSQLLAKSLASACHPKYPINLLDISKVLDGSNKQLLYELMNITYQRDFNCFAQSEALNWLRRNKFIK